MSRTKPHIHRSRSKLELLPLPLSSIRDLSLRHHLALAVLHEGQGSEEQVLTLVNALYTAFFLRQADSALYRQAEAALGQSVARARNGEPWSLTDAEYEILKPLVLLHDAQLATGPAYCYMDACAQIDRRLGKTAGSPLSVALSVDGN